MSAAVASVDIHFLKHRLRATWMAGDYDRFSRFMESSAVEFLDRVGIPPGASLLDVACAQSKLARKPDRSRRRVPTSGGEPVEAVTFAVSRVGRD